jgi:hypothetical protein
LSGGAESFFVARWELSLSDFPFGSFLALGGSQHRILGGIAPRHTSKWLGVHLCKTDHPRKEKKSPADAGL